MRVLFVAPTLPVPTSGGRTRLLNLVKQMARKHDVSVIAFAQPGEEGMLGEIASLCRHLVTVPLAVAPAAGPWRNRLQGWRQILFDRRPRYASTFPVDSMRGPLRRLLQAESFDVAVLHHLFVVELAEELGGLPAVLAEDNVESQIGRRAYEVADNPVHRLRDWLLWRRLRAFERGWVQRFRVLVAVSEDDASLLRAMAPQARIHVVPNGVDGDSFAPRPGERAAARLLFFGVLSYEPNVQGLAWFCEQVLPRVRAAHPYVELEVCGLHESPPVTALGRHPGVRITGFVPDIRPRLWQATASVVPLCVGGGTRLKILESLAAGCPVVSTTVGAEGLHLVDGEHLLLADDAEAFAGRLNDLLGSAELRRRLSEAGRRAVVERYDWGQIARSLEAACAEAISLCASR